MVDTHIWLTSPLQHGLIASPRSHSPASEERHLNKPSNLTAKTIIFRFSLCWYTSTNTRSVSGQQVAEQTDAQMQWWTERKAGQWVKQSKQKIEFHRLTYMCLTLTILSPVWTPARMAAPSIDKKKILTFTNKRCFLVWYVGARALSSCWGVVGGFLHIAMWFVCSIYKAHKWFSMSFCKWWNLMHLLSNIDSFVEIDLDQMK